MPRFHAQPRTYTSSKDREPNECCFRYAPFGVLRFEFVDAVQKECQYIDDSKIEEDDIYPVYWWHIGCKDTTFFWYMQIEMDILAQKMDFLAESGQFGSKNTTGTDVAVIKV